MERHCKRCGLLTDVHAESGGACPRCGALFAIGDVTAIGQGGLPQEATRTSPGEVPKVDPRTDAKPSEPTSATRIGKGKT